MTFAIGDAKWPGLSKLCEEAGEVGQVIGKLMGTGGEEEHWDGSNLRMRLIEEIGDVYAACDFVTEMNLDAKAVAQRRAQKLKLFRHWHGPGAKSDVVDATERRELTDALAIISQQLSWLGQIDKDYRLSAALATITEALGELDRTQGAIKLLLQYKALGRALPLSWLEAEFGAAVPAPVAEPREIRAAGAVFRADTFARDSDTITRPK